MGLDYGAWASGGLVLPGRMSLAPGADDGRM